MAISSPGIGSNLDVNGIVSKLMQVESQPLVLLGKQEAAYQGKLSAWGGLKSALATYQSLVSPLIDQSKFQGLTATSGDASVLTASATSAASAGSYTIVAGPLAQAHSLMATGRVSSTTSLANGATTLSFQFGTAGSPSSFGAAKTVTIAANSSLQNIADAVNTANIGVNASIVNDGSATPYRLVLNSTSTGAANSMSVTTADPTLQGILSYDQVGVGGLQNMTQTAAAQNATATINGVAVSSASNTLTAAIPGVTLNLGKAGTTTLNVARDTQSVKSAIEAFVKGYNDLTKTLKDYTGYNADTKVSGPLAGDATARMIQARLRGTLSAALTGLGGNLTSLAQIGISFQKDGTVALDSTKLQSAITNNFSDMAGLFAATGKTTDSLVRYTSSTANTQPGSYPVAVTALATQGNAVGSVALGATTTITAGVDDQLTLSVDGVSATVTLAAGSYTQSAMATQLQTAINGASAFSGAGISVSVTQAAGVLTLTSSRYGSASKVESISGTAQAALLGAPTSTAGVDVAGSINGLTAAGSGQYLSGAAGSTEGLKIQVTGGATGDRGTINFSQGYAYNLNKTLGNFLDSAGAISSRTDGINRSIKDIGNRRDLLNRTLAETERRYRQQFTALDVLVGQMNQTSNYLTQQLANLSNSSRN